ncbi:MAG: hypothetical protein KTU85_09690 [Acidimicrobiia bacterium]|nr:hypothetical protein [Acidimicrobiia bacterium]MCY4458764.1 hypothetical protein [Acidimicrobiaceae bacterium]
MHRCVDGYSFRSLSKSTPPRHAATFADAEHAGVIGRVARTKQLFGRVLPAHELAERQRVRSDAFLD